MPVSVVSDADRTLLDRAGIMAGMHSEIIQFRTGDRPQVRDLTEACTRFLADNAGERDGLLNIFVPHATAGVAILETGAGSDADLLATLDDLLPRDDRWQHRHGSAGHGRDHVLPALIAPSVSVPVLTGRLQLGTWQSVCLVDTNVDNAVRDVRLSFLVG
jgi:secondary thiamine-phosphate synthase enzyme